MKVKRIVIALLLSSAVLLPSCSRKGQGPSGFSLAREGYFRNHGVDVMAFDDNSYPEGHQGGVSLIMHGKRVAANGDVRLEATPGQWQPLARQLSRSCDDGRIEVSLCYPDSSRHLAGFNPMLYPDVSLSYRVRVEPSGNDIVVTVDLDSPVPEYLQGKVGFNLEIFPGWVIGKPWIMDDVQGIYPSQPSSPLENVPSSRDSLMKWVPEGGPVANAARLQGSGGYSPMVADDIIASPYAVGRRFISRPDDPYQKFMVESRTSELKLYDGRMNHNNGWFVLRSEIPAGATTGAVKWIITPSVVPSWIAEPVVQTSQVGYLPGQDKVAVIELDKDDRASRKAEVIRIDEEGESVVKTISPSRWGPFLRYNYLRADFSDVRTPGLYRIRYGECQSSVFRIGDDVFDRGVWQPVVEYFLPVQMCHMKVSEKYRVWHGLCHMDDALMAQVGNHIDGYVQDATALTYPSGAHVGGLALGGWHDAGDYDIRIESQAEETYVLSLAWENFHPDIDATAIDFASHTVEIHQGDGRNDILQQIENGAMGIVSGYAALGGRFYRGIISPDVRQYALLGDASVATDGIPGNADDRWVFTENNPSRELRTAAALAAASRALSGFNDPLSAQCLATSQRVFLSHKPSSSDREAMNAKVQAACELYLSTGAKEYSSFILDNMSLSISSRNVWFLSRVERAFSKIEDPRMMDFCDVFARALDIYGEEVGTQSGQTPYGVPYNPSICGAGWSVQEFAYRHYFLVSAYPEKFSSAPIYAALDFVLGCHPGSNTSSFASGVGARSATIAYGANRADWSYIPGGVVSGTALVGPDFPEMMEYPYLWQQSEYCIGGASSRYMFLVLAARHLSGRE